MKTRSDTGDSEQWIRSWLIALIFSWRTVAIGLAVVLLSFYAIENWRGRHAWENLKREMAGERLELADWIPEPIPDEENFAMAPIWLEARSATGHAQSPSEWFESDRLSRPWSDWLKSERVDLVKWQKYYRALHEQEMARGEVLSNLSDAPGLSGSPDDAATDVLLALSRFDQRLDQLREAARRPKSRFPIYENLLADTPLPHLEIMHSACRMLRLRAIAELACGRGDAAFEDVKLGLKLTGTLRNEPFLTSQLVRISMLELMLSVIWEGAGEHRWTEPQLLAIEEQLRLFDFLSDFDSFAQYIRASGLNDFDQIQASRIKRLLQLRPKEDNLSHSWELYYFMPAGWFDHNKVFYVNLIKQMGLPRINPSSHHIDLEDLRRSKLLVSQLADSRFYNFLALSMAQAYNGWNYRFAQIEAQVRMARASCALERSRLVFGRYPDSQESLAPRFIATLPEDVIGGGKLQYHPNGDDRFVLYSIGWNGLDDGGTVVTNPRGNVDRNRGDWVWAYPAK